jgi:hypothetical protein
VQAVPALIEVVGHSTTLAPRACYRFSSHVIIKRPYNAWRPAGFLAVGRKGFGSLARPAEIRQAGGGDAVYDGGLVAAEIAELISNRGLWAEPYGALAGTAGLAKATAGRGIPAKCSASTRTSCTARSPASMSTNRVFEKYMRCGRAHPASARPSLLSAVDYRARQPWENGCIESFNARDELINGKIFYTLREAQIISKAATPLQRDQAPHITRIQAASTRSVRACLRSVVGCVPATDSAGHAGATADLELSTRTTQWAPITPVSALCFEYRQQYRPEFRMEDTVAGSKGFRCSSWVASVSRI